MALPTEMIMDISRKVAQAWKTAMDKGMEKLVLLCDSRLRASLSAMLSRTVPLLPVVAYDEIVLGTEVEPIETISVQQLESMEQRSRNLLQFQSDNVIRRPVVFLLKQEADYKTRDTKLCR